MTASRRRRSPPPPDPGRRVVPGARIDLVRPTPADRDEFLREVAASGDLHDRWVEPARDAAGFDRYLARVARHDSAGWLVRVHDGGHLAGAVNLNAMFWGALCTGHVGYFGFAATAGRGYLTEAVELVVREAFGDIGLHRVEANIQPGNLRSRALVERLGFRLEGFSPRYLKVGGRWRDHERWAISAEEVEREEP